MIKKITEIFKYVKWWEILYLVASIIVVLVMGIVFHSGVISVFFSILNLITIFALGKGWFWGNIVGVMASSLYIVMCIFQHLYGEVIMSVLFAIPTYILCLFTWLKNLHKSSTVVHINKKISLKEWVLACCGIAVLSFGVYFLLKAFGTAFLLVSTISTSICFLARYMQVRRSEFNFLCYIFANLIGIVLWACVATTDFSFITTVITYMIQAIMNIFGFTNWIIIKRKQQQDDNFEIIKNCCLKPVD